MLAAIVNGGRASRACSGCEAELSAVLLDKQDHYATVTLNRPDVRNAFDPGMIRELTDAFLGLNADSRLRAVILRGEGKSFCAGADLAWMQSMVGFTLEQNRKDSEQLFDMFATLNSCPVPILGVVHGHVMGGALGLLSACDIVAAESNTVFAFSEARLGLVPAVISPFVAQKIRPSAAYRFMLNADNFTAEDALRGGLIHFHGDSAAVDQFVQHNLRTIVENGPQAVRASKALLREVLPHPDWNQVRAQTTQLIAERRVSAEGQEGLRGFLEKRRPSWKVSFTAMVNSLFKGSGR